MGIRKAVLEAAKNDEGRTQWLTPNYSWPPMEKRRVMGKRHKRLDGPVKASGTRQVQLRRQPARHAATARC